MLRTIGCGLALVALSAPARAADPPENMLPPTTQLYLRWDGITPHKAAYEASALGSVMKGQTGDTIRALLAKGPKLLGSSLLAEPLLAGKSPDDLRAVHADLKNLDKVFDLIADKGVIVAAEARGPQVTLDGLGKAFRSLLDDTPSPELFAPAFSMYIIVPDVGDRAPALIAAARLVFRHLYNVEPRFPPVLDKRGEDILTFTTQDERAPRAWCWVYNGHFIIGTGTGPVIDSVMALRANAAAGGLTKHPLYKRCRAAGGFESVARGFADTGAALDLAKRLAGPFVPGLADKLDATGVANLRAVVFSSGFKGKESRALYEIDLPGERKGLAKVLKPSPVTLADLPPLPPDVSRFSLLRLDLTAAYDAGLTIADVLAPGPVGDEENVKGKSPAEVSRLRRDLFERTLNKAVGMNVRADLLAHLGDRVVLFQSPTEGPSVFGTVLCVSVKDAAKARTAADRLTRAAEAAAGGQLRVRKKVLAGVEIREIYGPFGFLVPSYAVVGDWLVIAGHPQPVQGVILRHAGTLERWKPDADTTARLGKLPADAIGIQYCNPKSTVQNLCCVGPLFIGLLGQSRVFGSGSDFDPLDVGMVPNGHELSRHLFPNLTVTRDDGTTVRIEVNESFSLPLEFMGVEPVMFYAAVAGFRF